MEQYTVTGMSCAACSARVEKAVCKLPGVESCSVSLLTNSMGVEGTVGEEEIIRAVQEAGYGASRKQAGVEHSPQMGAEEEVLKDRETLEAEVSAYENKHKNEPVYAEYNKLFAEREKALQPETDKKGKKKKKISANNLLSR